MLKEIGYISNTGTDLDKKLHDILTSSEDRFIKCVKNLSKAFEDYDFLAVVPIMLLSGASIINTQNNGIIEMTILVEEDRMDAFYENLESELYRIIDQGEHN